MAAGDTLTEDRAEKMDIASTLQQIATKSQDWHHFKLSDVEDQKATLMIIPHQWTYKQRRRVILSLTCLSNLNAHLFLFVVMHSAAWPFSFLWYKWYKIHSFFSSIKSLRIPSNPLWIFFSSQSADYFIFLHISSHWQNQHNTLKSGLALTLKQYKCVRLYSDEIGILPFDTIFFASHDRREKKAELVCCSRCPLMFWHYYHLLFTNGHVSYSSTFLALL